MAMISPKLRTRNATPFRFSISAHGSSSSSQRSLAAAADKRKVFEDLLRGMVCYIEEKGEMICEGYDEGSRLGTTPLPENGRRFGTMVPDFIQLAKLKLFEDADVLHRLKGAMNLELVM